MNATSDYLNRPPRSIETILSEQKESQLTWMRRALRCLDGPSVTAGDVEKARGYLRMGIEGARG